MSASFFQIDMWRDELVGLGFTRLGHGRGYRRDHHLIGSEGGWLTLADGSWPSDRDPLSGPLGHPGLWRLVSANGSGTARLFELPPQLTGHGPGGASSTLVPRDAVSWALATCDGASPADWVVPSSDEVAACIPGSDLTVQAGDQLRQGSVIHEEDRLAIRFPIVSDLDPDLSEARAAWLRALLLDAQRTWRMVRIGVEEDGAARAEVDLTGAPHALFDRLSRTALDALRLVVEWLVPVAAFVVDPSRRSLALEALSPRVGLVRADDPQLGGTS